MSGITIDIINHKKHNHDELSIDSKTNCKIPTNMTTITCDTTTTISKASTADHFRPHFRIDWRQLSYYHNQGRSLPSLEQLFNWRHRKRVVVSNELNDENCPSGQAPDEALLKGFTGSTGNRKCILNSLDGCFKSGELNAILGPSGAGKSTFLSALFGNKQESSYGQTRVTYFHPDGRQIEPEVSNRQLEKKTIQIAFLPQHDHLLNHLTVYETLEFASRIKNPSHAQDKHFHRANVRRVAKMLKLTDCFNTRCGQLSGGQHKRVSIGQELLSQPDVIILDEPTSGLDAMTCLTTIRTLKSICAQQPICIILTIHQPDTDVFNLFDQVYVIAQGGVAIYEGPPNGVATALARVNLYMPSENYNPARFIVENAFVADLETTSMSTPSTSDGDDDQEEEDDDEQQQLADKGNFLSRSISSLTETVKTIGGVTGNGTESQQLRSSGRRPLLNLAIQTAEGKLITSEMLAMRQANAMNKAQMERMNLLKRLNELQRSNYYDSDNDFNNTSSYLSSEIMSRHADDAHAMIGTSSSSGEIASSASSLSTSSSYSEARSTVEMDDHSECQHTSSSSSSSSSSSPIPTSIPVLQEVQGEKKEKKKKLRRKFDKRLSAKHNQSRARNQPTWRHARLLAHRTWLSIVRDPIFFGIQFAMHTTIPILLALIFGSQQDEGCPQVGPFDLVEFAYQPSHGDFIHTTMRSIRQSIGNIGIMFFEMFVLCFAINCITALVFPLDMYVLLKEYRNGWYSLRAYFFGRTLADLPVPIILHSMAMCIIYYLTGQPLVWWRLISIVAIVILASLVAQSIGLTIGALLMRSSQSAVLAAAGIVAPFFALSGFIVRIHTLPWLAQFAARGISYLYHLLNGFIILRYGFQRCQCDEEDFSREPAHIIPSNLKTMASIWIGTYSNEYEHETHQLVTTNRTNIDPNIDIMDKLMAAFKMANSFGHQVNSCSDLLPYAMLDFELKDSDIWSCCWALIVMLIVSRIITFSAIYYKIRSFS